MTRVLAIALLVGLNSTAVRAHSTALARPTAPRTAASQGCAGQDSDAQALLRLEDDWARALVRRDAATFQRLLADGFVYTEDDRVMSREAVLRDIVAGPDSAQAARNEGMQVHCFGTTAAVTGWLIVRGRGARGPSDRRYRFTDTWVRQRRGWQIVAAHDYLVPAQPR